MYGMDKLEHILVNAPIPVKFAGLMGNTMSMQKDGWELALEQDLDHYSRSYRIRLAGRHRGWRLQLLSTPTIVDIAPIKMDRGYIPNLMFNIAVCAETIHFQTVDMPKFEAVDFSRPSLEAIEPLMQKHFSLEECCFFRPMNNEMDVYVPKDEIWTMEKELKKILESQKGRQAELREKARKRITTGAGDMLTDTTVDNSEVKLQLVAI